MTRDSRVAPVDPASLDTGVLLGRPPLPIDFGAARRALDGARILVTGAGGSVGQHLAETLLALEPRTLALLDHHDHALHALRKRLDALASEGGASPAHSPVRLVLADVRDPSRLARVFADVRPDVVFHLAAYKHVPFGEEFPEETFAVNVVATETLLRLAGEYGVARFVYPSSDKAVNPPSMYGATKRLSETLVQRAALDLKRRFVVARYVNILGTNGSVIETFAQQVAAGQPLTVTDERMLRYWISMPEATWLLAQAVTLGTPADVLMLDVPGEVATVAMARRVEALVAPGRPELPLRITGLRPGERLREELVSEHEELTPGPCPGVLAVTNRRRAAHVEAIDARMARLRALADGSQSAQLKSDAMDAARALQ